MMEIEVEKLCFNARVYRDRWLPEFLDALERQGHKLITVIELGPWKEPNFMKYQIVFQYKDSGRITVEHAIYRNDSSV
jgi:hypothetical protein